MEPLKIGDIAVHSVSGKFGVVTDIDPGTAEAKIVHAHKQTWRGPLAELAPYEPPPLTAALKFGQFVKSGKKELIGKLLKVIDGKFTMLCADGNCYPKGARYAEGGWFNVTDIRTVSAEEQETFLFKLSRRHTAEEYIARLAKTKNEWAAAGLADTVPKFEVFWTKIMELLGDRPGVNWGARLRTIYGPAPTLNAPPEHPADLQANMICFFELTNDNARPELHAFVKDLTWISDAARPYFPEKGDKEFFAGGNHSVIPIGKMGKAELAECAEAAVSIYRAAVNSLHA